MLAAGNLTQWRYLVHTRPDDLLPITPSHDAASYIEALRPPPHCSASCHHGYCTTRPSIVYDVSSNQWVHRGGDAKGSLDPNIPDAADEEAALSPQCDCFPDIAKKVGPKQCQAVRPAPEVQCMDSCSFVGVCARGGCVCPPGFWGPDCGLSISDNGRPLAWKGEHFQDRFDMSQADSMPGMYVYDMKPTWAGYLYQTRYRPLRTAPPLLCRAYNIRHVNLPLTVLWPQRTYACRVFIDAMLVSPFRVADPAEAAFFWIPMCQGSTTAQVTANVMRHVMEDLPYFNRSIAAGFANHVIVQPGDYGFASRAWGLQNLHPFLQRPVFRPSAILPVLETCSGNLQHLRNISNAFLVRLAAIQAAAACTGMCFTSDYSIHFV